jgi:hypothetical protein
MLCCDGIAVHRTAVLSLHSSVRIARSCLQDRPAIVTAEIRTSAADITLGCALRKIETQAYEKPAKRISKFLVCVSLIRGAVQSLQVVTLSTIAAGCHSQYSRCRLSLSVQSLQVVTLSTVAAGCHSQHSRCRLSLSAQSLQGVALSTVAAGCHSQHIRCRLSLSVQSLQGVTLSTVAAGCYQHSRCRLSLTAHSLQVVTLSTDAAGCHSQYSRCSLSLPL